MGSWPTMLETPDDTDQLLDTRLQDGRARAKRGYETKVARKKKLQDGKSRERTRRSLDLPLQNSVPVDRTTIGERHPASIAG